MRAPSWLIGSKAALAEPETPKIDDERLKARLNAVRRSFRRRLTDRIEDLFEEACLSGDIATADDLFQTLERMQARAELRETNPRRRPRIPLAALRAELELSREQHAMDTLPPAGC